jgi:hypothetical protein
MPAMSLFMQGGTTGTGGSSRLDLLSRLNSMLTPGSLTSASHSYTAQHSLRQPVTGLPNIQSRAWLSAPSHNSSQGTAEPVYTGLSGARSDVRQLTLDDVDFDMSAGNSSAAYSENEARMSSEDSQEWLIAATGEQQGDDRDIPVSGQAGQQGDEQQTGAAYHGLLTATLESAGGFRNNSSSTIASLTGRYALQAPLHSITYSTVQL